MRAYMFTHICLSQVTNLMLVRIPVPYWKGRKALKSWNLAHSLFNLAISELLSKWAFLNFAIGIADFDLGNNKLANLAFLLKCIIAIAVVIAIGEIIERVHFELFRFSLPAFA